MPSLANKIDDSPALLATLQALQRQLSKFAATQTATKQNGQDRPIALSGKSLSVGYLPERCRFARRKPVAQTRAQLADTFNAMNTGGQFRAQQSGISRLVSQPSHGRDSHVDRPGREAALLQVKAIAQNHCFVEGQSWFRTVPGNELIDGMLISPHSVGRTKAPQDCGFRMFQSRYTKLGLWSALLALCIRWRFPHDFRPPLRRIMRLIGQ